jgi:hypothetical protein
VTILRRKHALGSDQAPANAEAGDVMIRVFGGWVVILLGVSTGTVYEGNACVVLE